MTYILAATEQTALKLARLILASKLPPMADDLEAAEALRQLHPRPLRYGLAIWAAKIENGRLDPVSVDLASPSELAAMRSPCYGQTSLPGMLERMRLRMEKRFGL